MARWSLSLGGGQVATMLSRRALGISALAGTPALLAHGGAATAFKNRLYDTPDKKTPGKRPSILGAVVRKPDTEPDLAGCGTSPNCFSSAVGSNSSTFRFAPAVEKAHYLEPWRFAGGGAAKALADVEEVVRGYKPGQRGVDGGGFEIQKVDPEKGYLYVQFESLRFGFIDDVEFLVRPDAPGSEAGELRVRSASRQGTLDYGVNAKRLNRIAEDLQALPGGRWTAPALTAERFPEYVKKNR